MINEEINTITIVDAFVARRAKFYHTRPTRVGLSVISINDICPYYQLIFIALNKQLPLQVGHHLSLLIPSSPPL